MTRRGLAHRPARLAIAVTVYLVTGALTLLALYWTVVVALRWLSGVWGWALD
ncbi:hypothetical protein KIK06_01230 [Nocardiopsis sp. EMB25]|uniref:hypothetical protein n=1 Tax=Nocardiopsis TaxID=2013 RepID=UPI0013780C98|nr:MULTISPECIES: hypothetical protein [Nocardiopsis]MCY9782509.1 hypothetical protein [Nocardiopsis sp. EMB25]